MPTMSTTGSLMVRYSILQIICSWCSQKHIFWGTYVCVRHTNNSSQLTAPQRRVYNNYNTCRCLYTPHKMHFAHPWYNLCSKSHAELSWVQLTCLPCLAFLPRYQVIETCTNVNGEFSMVEYYVLMQSAFVLLYLSFNLFHTGVLVTIYEYDRVSLDNNTNLTNSAYILSPLLSESYTCTTKRQQKRV